MKKLGRVIFVIILLCLAPAFNVIPANAEEESLNERMTTGDLSFDAMVKELHDGNFKKVEAIIKERTAEDLYNLSMIQTLQLKCKEAKETYKKVLEFYPNHKGALEELKDNKVCP
jgi:hypothetical protein